MANVVPGKKIKKESLSFNILAKLAGRILIGPLGVDGQMVRPIGSRVLLPPPLQTLSMGS